MAGELVKQPDKSGEENPARIRPTLPRIALGLVLICAVLIIAGFARYAWNVSTPGGGSQIGKADAIVVLTGGPDRIRSGIELLKDGMADRLLITGVHQHTSDITIRRVANVEQALFECCVDIDRLALDTIGNARYTSIWVMEHGYEKIVIVTSSYHMPRSLMLMQRAMPDAQLVAAPVRTLEGNSLVNPNTIRILLFEYAKYLAAWVYGIF